MNTLMTVLNDWAYRYSLTKGERIDLGSEISRRLDWPSHKFPPLPVRMAEKMGALTYQALLDRFMEERLAPDTVRQPAGTPEMRAALGEPEPAVVPPPKRTAEEWASWERKPLLSRRPPSVMRKCGGCREYGHRIERCPNNPAAKNPVR